MGLRRRRADGARHPGLPHPGRCARPADSRAPEHELPANALGRGHAHAPPHAGHRGRFAQPARLRGARHPQDPARPAPGAKVRRARYDGILIKENHIAAAGSVTAALRNAQALVAAQASPLREQITIQVEVETLEQLREALAADATSVLLDNFSLDMMREAVRINQEVAQGRALLEVSGGVTLAQLRGIAETGVDRISIGKLTKDVQAVDFSMRVLGRLG